ncbi:MAG: cytochrome P460 family protein [Pseudomonadota bacterium]
MSIILRFGFAGFAGAMALAIGLTSVTDVHAEACKTDLKRDDVVQDQANALYACIEAKLLEGYSKATDVPGVPGYKDWKLVTTAPLVSATHGKMFVNHYVNDLGADLYTKWEDMDGAKFPVGTIFAKESFRISKGEVKRGPLFLMEKVAADAAPDGWVYTRLFPNGKYQRTNGNKSEKMAFCHECHAATLDAQDAAFFPPEEYRTAN